MVRHGRCPTFQPGRWGGGNKRAGSRSFRKGESSFPAGPNRFCELSRTGERARQKLPRCAGGNGIIRKCILPWTKHVKSFHHEHKHVCVLCTCGIYSTRRILISGSASSLLFSQKRGFYYIFPAPVRGSEDRGSQDCSDSTGLQGKHCFVIRGCK